MKKLLSKSQFGIETWMHHDGETIAIEHVQDVTPILELNKKLRNEFTGYKDVGDHHFHKYATIPPLVIMKWMNEYGINALDPDHAPAVKRLLNDSEWRYLRTTEGNI